MMPSYIDGVYLDVENLTIRVDKRMTLNHLYSRLMERFDDFDMLVYPNPILPITNYYYTMAGGWRITEDSMRFLTEGTLDQYGVIYTQRQRMGVARDPLPSEE